MGRKTVMGNGQISPIIPKDVWIGSPLSVARFYGGATINGHDYFIVNAQGETVEEISMRLIKENNPRQDAIPQGEPADMVRRDWLTVYRTLGRDRTRQLVKAKTPLKEARRIARESTINVSRKRIRK